MKKIKLRILVFVILFLFIDSYAHCQIVQDSLVFYKSELEKAKNGDKLRVLNKLCYYSMYNDYEENHDYAVMLEQEALQQNHPDFIALAYLYQHNYYNLKEFPDTGTVYLDKALEINVKTNDSVRVTVYLTAALNRLLVQDVEIAHQYIDSADSVLKPNNYRYLNATILFYKGYLQSQEGDDLGGIKTVKESIVKLYELDRQIEITNHLVTLGYLYYNLHLDNKAIGQAKETVRIAKITGNRNDESIAYNLLSNSYLNKSLDSTMRYFDLYDSVTTLFNYNEGLFVGYSSKAMAYTAYLMHEEAEKQLDFIEDWKKDKKLASDQGYLSSLRATNYLEQKKNKLALKYINKAIEEAQDPLYEGFSLNYYYTKIQILKELHREDEIEEAFGDLEGVLMRTKDSFTTTDFYSYKYQYYEGLKRYREAFFSLKRFLYFKDSIAATITNDDVGFFSILEKASLNKENVSLKEDVEESEETIGRLKWVSVFAVASVLILILSFFVYNSIKETKRLAKTNERLNILVDEKTAELKELVSTKDKFLSIISHDLKNPFNAILGFSELLKTNYDSFSKDDHKHFINNIASAANNSYKLLNNLLSWTRAQTGSLKAEKTYFDIGQTIQDSVSFFREQAMVKRITIVNKVGYDLIVNADENMIETTIRNLIQNAIKFTYEGKKIILDSEQKGDLLYLSVIDQGVGIPKKKVDKLFNIEEQTTSPGTNNESGTGLGLLLCHEFIRLNDGQILIESEEGKGSTFTIIIPVVKQEERKSSSSLSNVS